MIRLLFTILFLSSSLRADLIYNNNSYPNVVDLGFQFHPTTQKQIGGSCHVFSAVALYEAACFRALKKKVDISEAYLFNRHLNSQISQIGAYNLDLHLQTETIAGAQYDAGWPENTLKRIFNGSVCTEREFPQDSNFLYSLQQIIIKQKGQYEQNKCSVQIPYQLIKDENGVRVSPEPKNAMDNDIAKLKIELAQRQHHLREVDRWLRENDKFINVKNRRAISDQKNLRESLIRRINHINGLLQSYTTNLERHLPKLLCHKLDNQVSCKFDSLKQNANGELTATTNDPLLKHCLSLQIGFQKSPFSTGLALDLLSKEIPFICYAKFRFPSGKIERHVSTVIGYRYNQQMNDNIEYLLRDSNHNNPTWGWNLKCDEILYIHP